MQQTLGVSRQHEREAIPISQLRDRTCRRVHHDSGLGLVDVLRRVVTLWLGRVAGGVGELIPSWSDGSGGRPQ
ncbi:hypothetical protein BST26_07425 [Mycolicibacterium insubricum]|uniref:Uncharacterized protein n=1 Tax=Mycolicibacterium insubricum TaxID=444597 RepID=A0A1X0DGS4_9MYCO|nr:hypothetical protein BST26_07425 [Mycolicibacterium insubricum]